MQPKTTRAASRGSRLYKLMIVLVASVAAAGAAAAGAAADTITSDNWSGYAAHRTGVKFRRVSGTWRQPSAVCTAGTATYSAFWVGIGGYSLSSQALEQIGSELDCNADGTESMSAWYELVPSPSHTIRITIAGGDLIRASLSVVGKRVSVTLADVTRHETFTKTIVQRTVDTTSAEWIAEAPSDCSSTTCTTLPLADFNAVRFANASAETTMGKTGTISSSLWGETKLLLGYTASGSRFVANTTTANATPTALLHAGSSFLVDYTGSTTSTGSGSGGSGSPSAGTGGGTPGSGGPGGYGGDPGAGGGGGGGPGGGFGGPTGSTRK